MNGCHLTTVRCNPRCIAIILHAPVFLLGHRTRIDLPVFAWGWSVN